MIQSPIPYCGSKTRIMPWLLRHFPAHSLFLEPFCGSARVLLAKTPSPAELISDLDPYVINFWQQVRDNWHLLKFRCLYDFDRQFFLFARKHLWTDDRLEAARRFYAATKPTYKGLPKTVTFDPCKQGSFFAGLNKLEAVSKRLKAVRIERCSYETALLLNDHAEAFAYLDPPYHPDTWANPNAYRMSFSAAQHSELLSLVRSLNSKVMLSGHDHPEYRRALCDWNMKRRRTFTRLGSDHQTASRTEFIWTNY